MPVSARNHLKSWKIEALNLVRSEAIWLHERSYLSNFAIKQQVEATLAFINSNAATSFTYAASTGRRLGYELFTADLTISTLIKDEINNFSYNDNTGPANDKQGNGTSINNYRSQAEQTMNSYKGGYIQSYDPTRGLPRNFVQQFETKDGKKFPKHPDHQHYTSYVPVGHKGCYYCAEDHEFRSCPRRDEPRALYRMIFNMHYQPRIYFIYKGRSRGNNRYQNTSQSIIYQHEPPDSSESHNSKRIKWESDENSASGGRGGGRNLPAWMTRPSNNNIVAGHYIPDNTSSSFNHAPRYGAHRNQHIEHDQYDQHNQHSQYDWHTQHNQHSSTSNQQQTDGDNRGNTDFYLYITIVTPFNYTDLRTMAITSDNCLPLLSLQLGWNRLGPNISEFYDTGAALIIGYLPHHMFIKLQSPEIVHSFEAFDLVGPFNFLPKAHYCPAKQLIGEEQCSALAGICHSKGLVPPMLSFDSAMATNTIVVSDTWNPVPWYQLSTSFSNVVFLSQPSDALWFIFLLIEGRI